MLLSSRRVVLQLLNGTAAPSVLGQVVQVKNTAANTYEAADADDHTAVGVVLQSGVAVGAYVPICVVGKAQVLIATDNLASHGAPLTMSATEAGRAAGQVTYVGGSTAQGLGSVLEAAAAGGLAVGFVNCSKSKDVDCTPVA